MMRLLRLLVVLMLTLTLPLSGMAGIASATEPCPMQAMGMTATSAMTHDCCQDQDKSSGHASKACKVGQECRSAGTLQVNLAEPARPFAAPAPTDTYTQGLVNRAPSDLWRPPRT